LNVSQSPLSHPVPLLSPAAVDNYYNRFKKNAEIGLTKKKLHVDTLILPKWGSSLLGTAFENNYGYLTFLMIIFKMAL